MGGRMAGLGLDNIGVSINREELLKRLITNRATHIAIYKEARAGYLVKATQLLRERLEKLEQGKLVNLDFDLRPPTSYEDAYTTVIEMFSMTDAVNISLSSSQFRMLVQDQWEWRHSFLLSNSGYSALAHQAYASEYGDPEM